MKYEFVEGVDVRLGDGRDLKRIKALRDVGSHTKKGDLGGYIESEVNLSHSGDAAVRGNGVLDGRIKVS